MNNSDMQGERHSGIHRATNVADFRFTDTDPDVRGWEVIGTDGQRIGRVYDVMVDLAQYRIRYLDVITDRSATRDTLTEHHVLVPVGIALADEREDVIRIENVDTPTIQQLPAFSGDVVTREHEDELFNVLKAYEPNTTNIRREFYDHSYFDNSRFYSARRPRSGQRGHDSFLPFQTDNS
jgi:sporulation protein YlmC with PRC-barrel domain